MYYFRSKKSNVSYKNLGQIAKESDIVDLKLCVGIRVYPFSLVIIINLYLILSYVVHTCTRIQFVYLFYCEHV